MTMRNPSFRSMHPEIGQEDFNDLKQRMLNAVKYWSGDDTPSWTEKENELKAYGDVSSWHDSHDDSSSSTCWVDFYAASDTSELEWQSECSDYVRLIDGIPCKRSAKIRDESKRNRWSDNISYYLDEPYGLRGVWILSFRKYKD